MAIDGHGLGALCGRPAPTTSLRAEGRMTAAIGREGDALVVALTGDWTLDADTPQFAPLADAARTGTAPPGDATAALRAVTFECTTLGAWDSSLLIFLRQGEAWCATHKLDLTTTGLPARITSLLALARAVPERVSTGDEAAPLPAVARLGVAGLKAWDATLHALSFVGEVAIAGAGLFTGRVRMRWRPFWVVVQSNSSGALPIVGLIALLVGIIIAFLGVVVLRRFGAGYYASYLVGSGMLREMGALMTGIIMAGRTGAGFAAELGTMKITEEIDALSTLGISPIDHLVLPRVLGLFVMMPLLVVYADVVGVIGGLGVSVALLDLSPALFMHGLLEAVTFSDATLGIAKATVYGAIIGLAGCFKGLQTGTDAGAVGRSATSAVVSGITVIILANAVIDWLSALGHA
jgi:phospholipid/cholesterol/gamma-HCH transport system permease protein